MKATTAFLCLLLLLSNHSKAAEFSEWMPANNLTNFIDINKAAKYPQGGHIIHAIQGRYQQGENQYRIILTKKPQQVSRWWFWYGQDIQSFTQKVKTYQEKGAVLFGAQSFKGKGGKVFFQAVWIEYR